MRPQKIIQNYQVSHLLGSGGMGEVWAGKHMYMDRKVAVKALHPGLVSNPEIRARFKNEAVTMSQLQHPNIVQLYDYIEDDDGVYLVMEFVEGYPLDQYIARKTGPIPEAPARHLFEQMLLGLEYAHERGVVHRDIKPSNFMVTPDHQIKILDFGIAKLLEQVGGQRTKTGARIGTVLYMSPEQVQGLELDARSDIYAMGVTLFQMLTGQCPYSSQATEYEIYQRIVNEPLPRAASIYPAVSAHMQAVIDKATAKQLKGRFQTCLECLAAVQGDWNGAKSKTPPPPAAATIGPKPQPTVSATVAMTPRKKGLHWAVKLCIWLLILGGIGSAAAILGLPMLQQELAAAAERTPSLVATEFLDDIERGKFDQASYLTAGNCGDDMLRLSLSNPNKHPRKVHIYSEETNGTKSVVRFKYDNNRQGQVLRLQRRRGIWEVYCN